MKATYQSWPDLNQSFNKFKKQFFMEETKSKLDTVIDKGLDEMFNLGVDRCIAFVKSQRDIYYAINPKGNEVNVLKAIASTLEHFKKPTPLQTQLLNHDELNDKL